MTPGHLNSLLQVTTVVSFNKELTGTIDGGTKLLQSTILLHKHSLCKNNELAEVTKHFGVAVPWSGG
jgi:hypothetical protein